MLTKIIAKEEQTTQQFHLTDMKETARKCAKAEATIALILLHWDLSLVAYII